MAPCAGVFLERYGELLDSAERAAFQPLRGDYEACMHGMRHAHSEKCIDSRTYAHSRRHALAQACCSCKSDGAPMI